MSALEPANSDAANPMKPVRGALSLLPTLSSPNVSAGDDFSIFVTVQNPFDVPVTLYEVKTHLPVELVDVNGVRLALALKNKESSDGEENYSAKPPNWLQRRRAIIESQTGFATAVSTDFSPDKTAQFLQASVSVAGGAKDSQITGVLFDLHFPENPDSNELDMIMRRIMNYRSGVVPIRLEPGDSVVRQFRLRTRHWLFFTPLTHTFQIQAYFSVDGADHNCTITFPITVRARMAAVVAGGLSGAIIGSQLKVLTQPSFPPSPAAYLQGVIIALLATTAVVVGFARKSGSQSFVSVEDFWGGALIGFSVGFVGYSQFSALFRAGP